MADNDLTEIPVGAPIGRRLDTLGTKWAERLITFQKATGQKPTALKSLFERDMKSVLGGGTGMTEAEAIAAITTIARNKSTIEPPKQKTDLFSLPGNALSDIGDIVRTIPKIPSALYNEVKDVVGYATGDSEIDSSGVKDFGGGLRAVAKAPGFRMIPVVNTLANLTSSEGRKEILENPLITALDVAPLVGKALKVGARAAIKATPSLADDIAKREALTAAGRRPPLSKIEGIVQAAQQGRPFRTAYRAALPQKTQQLVRDSFSTVLRKYNLDADSINLSRNAAVAQRALNNELKQLEKDVKPYYEGMDVEEQSLLYNEATMPDLYPNPSESHQPILAHLRETIETLAEKGGRQKTLSSITWNGNTQWYSMIDSSQRSVVDSYKKVGIAHGRLQKANQRLEKSYAFKERERIRLQKKVDEAKKRVDYWSQKKGQKAFLKASTTYRIALENLEKLDTRPTFIKAFKDAERAKVRANEANARFAKKYVETAPAKYRPRLEAEMHARAVAKAMEEANGDLAEPTLRDALARMEQGDYSSHFTPQEWRKLAREVAPMWVKLMQDGYDPYWVESVPEHSAKNVLVGRSIGEEFITPAQVKTATLGSMIARHPSVAVAVTQSTKEYLEQAAREDAILTHFLPYGRTVDELNKEIAPTLEAQFAKASPLQSKRGIRQGTIYSNYVRIKDGMEIADEGQIAGPAFGIQSARVQAAMKDTDLYVPKHVYNMWKKLSEPDKVGPIGAASRQVNSIFKLSLFAFSPKHMADEVFGNGLAIMLRSGKEELGQFRKAVNAVKNGEMPVDVSRGVDLISTDNLLEYSKSKTLGRWYKKLHADAPRRFIEYINNVERMVGYFGELERQAKKGVADPIARQKAALHANKISVDWDSMLPIERTIIKQVIPFYSFQKFMFNYLRTYPLDHPLRAAIISRFADNEREDWNTSLPTAMQQLFHIGKVGSDGKQRVIDMRTINPFRDAGNAYTMAGFISALGPLIDTPLSLMGVNTLSATPELYPDLSLDDQGRLVAKRVSPASREGIMRIVGNVLPVPTGTIDHFFQLSDRLRRLEKNDPIGYRKQLFQSLNLPFVPYREDIALTQAKQQTNRVKVAQARVSDVLSGDADPGEITRYNLVPYEGQLVNPELLAQILARVKPLADDLEVSPRLLIPRS